MTFITHVLAFSAGCICTALAVLAFEKVAATFCTIERQAYSDDYPHEHWRG